MLPRSVSLMRHVATCGLLEATSFGVVSSRYQADKAGLLGKSDYAHPKGLRYGFLLYPFYLLFLNNDTDFNTGITTV